MIYTLNNKQLKIKIAHPLHGYKSSRFDWTGKIFEIFFDGIQITTIENPSATESLQLGAGLYNEFLDYEHVEIEKWFHKIGVGLIKKSRCPTDYSMKYEIKPANFNVIPTNNRLIIKCKSDVLDGYAYVLNKEIILKENTFTVEYLLENTGEKKIKIDEYIHNFLAINHDPISPSYSLTFPFQIRREGSKETVNPSNVFTFNDNEIHFNKQTEHQFFMDHINGKQCVNAQWELLHSIEKIGIRETASFQSNKINLWGWKHVISPELYHHIQIEPKEFATWSRCYEFFRID